MTMPELQMVRQAILRELAEALAFAGLQVQHKGTHRIMFALIRLPGQASRGLPWTAFYFNFPISIRRRAGG